MKRKLVWLLAIVVVLVNCRACRNDGHTSTPHIDSSPTAESTLAATTEPTAVATATPAIPVESLTEYLWFVVPVPGESYTVSEYENLAPSLGWNATLPGICFPISFFWLVEPGDLYTLREWLNRVHLVVDDVIITEYHSLLEQDTLGGVAIDPETGETISKVPDGDPAMVCYAIPLDVGQHTATITVEKTSGEQLSYSWSFVITE